MDLNELKDRYRIPQAWRDLGLPGLPSASCPSPLRKDRNPSFSVFGEGRRFHDFATGDRGDVLDLVASVRGWNIGEAIRYVQERLGVITQAPASPLLPNSRPNIPTLRSGTEAELRTLAEQRNFSPETLRLAQQRGFLRFCELWGLGAWCLTDSRLELHEFRRIDGAKWPAYGRLPERKCHCLGVGKAWPIGTMESVPFPRVAVVEGAPDFLAALHFIVAENKLDTVAPVGILGASNHRLAPEALALFRGKHVCLYPHVDDAGGKAVFAWARQFKDAGAARVSAFSLSGLVKEDGSGGKDLADLLKIHPDCFEAAEARKFREVMP
jgi:hypothetical protein